MADTAIKEDRINTSPEQVIKESFNKALGKQVEEGTARQLQQGIDPSEVLSSFIGTLKNRQQPQIDTDQLIQQLLEVAGTQVPTGEKRGIIPSLLKTGKLKRIPETEALGISPALGILKLQQQQQQQSKQAPQQQLNLIKTLQDILSQTPAGRRQSEINKAEGQALAQESKESAKTARNFKIAEQKLELTFKKFDEAIKETEKITKGAVQGSGRFGGLVTSGLGAIGRNPKVAGFKGQLVETATAIAKIAAPSAKVGPELIKLFSTTLPDISFFGTTTTSEAIDQTATSITNAFINFAVTNPDQVPGEIDTDTLRSSITDMLTRISQRTQGNKQVTPTSQVPIVTAEQRAQFNQLRTQGLSAEEARKQVGF